MEELWGLTAFKIHFAESSNLFWNVQKWAIWWNLVAAAEQESLKLKFASCSQYKIVSVLNLKNNNIILVAVCKGLHAFVSRMLLIIPSIISMYLIRRTWMCTWNLNSRILFTCRRHLEGFGPIIVVDIFIRSLMWNIGIHFSLFVLHKFLTTNSWSPNAFVTCYLWFVQKKVV